MLPKSDVATKSVVATKCDATTKSDVATKCDATTKSDAATKFSLVEVEAPPNRKSIKTPREDKNSNLQSKKTISKLCASEQEKHTTCCCSVVEVDNQCANCVHYILLDPIKPGGGQCTLTPHTAPKRYASTSNIASPVIGFYFRLQMKILATSLIVPSMHQR